MITAGSSFDPARGGIVPDFWARHLNFATLGQFGLPNNALCVKISLTMRPSEGGNADPKPGFARPNRFERANRPRSDTHDG
jgi:hypothetical protein